MQVCSLRRSVLGCRLFGLDWRALAAPELTRCIVRRFSEGGRAIEAVRSLVISQQLLGTREVYVVHHTDCGMLTFKDSDLAKIIKDNLGVDVGAREFYPFSDVDQSIKDDVALLAKEPLILKGTPIIGLRYDCTVRPALWLSPCWRFSLTDALSIALPAGRRAARGGQG